MRGEHFYGHLTERKSVTRPGRPAERQGVYATGRIQTLYVGQGYGFIRLPSDEQVYFHRKDIEVGTSINDLAVGDNVAFELLGDPVSGARALRVRPLPATK